MFFQGRFADLNYWRRTRRGNLSRVYEHITFTIFRRKDGRIMYRMQGPADKKPFYSHGSFDTEDQAIAALEERRCMLVARKRLSQFVREQERKEKKRIARQPLVWIGPWKMPQTSDEVDEMVDRVNWIASECVRLGITIDEIARRAERVTGMLTLAASIVRGIPGLEESTEKIEQAIAHLQESTQCVSG